MLEMRETLVVWEREALAEEEVDLAQIQARHVEG
jgi:hypothetical protein